MRETPGSKRQLELERLRNSLASGRGDEPTVLALASRLYDEIRNGEGACLSELKALVSSHQAVTGLVPILAKALYSSIFYAEEEDDSEAIVARLRELREIVSRHKSEPDVRDAFAMTISYLYGSSDPAHKAQLRVELASLAAEFPEDSELNHWLKQLI